MDVLDDRRPTSEQFVRQTDGAGHVVSGNAELDLEAMSWVEHLHLLHLVDWVAHAELVAVRIHQYPTVAVFRAQARFGATSAQLLQARRLRLDVGGRDGGGNR